MKKSFYIIVFLMIASLCHSQETIQSRESVKSFYKLLFQSGKVTVVDFSRIYWEASTSYETELRIKKKESKGINDYQLLQKEIIKNADTLTSKVFLGVLGFKTALTQGLNFGSIAEVIDSASMLTEGLPFSTIVELRFPNKTKVYFEVSNAPSPISNVWLPTGESLCHKTQGYKTSGNLRRPAIINDPDGCTNIRAKPDKNSKIVGRFNKNEIFFYTPVSGSDWFPVYKDEGARELGFMHKSKILEYSTFPKEIKEKVDSLRSGC